MIFKSCEIKRIIIWIFFFAIVAAGIYFIIKSQIQYNTEPCKVIKIISFECSYTFLTPYKNLNYLSNTTLLILVGNKSSIIYMKNYCYTCADCEDTYIPNKTYDCLKTEPGQPEYNDSPYIIIEYIFGISRTYQLVIGILAIIAGFILLIMMHLDIIVRLFRKNDYDEIE